MFSLRKIVYFSAYENRTAMCNALRHQALSCSFDKPSTEHALHQGEQVHPRRSGLCPWTIAGGKEARRRKLLQKLTHCSGVGAEIPLLSG